jgi:hypothetical protein
MSISDNPPEESGMEWTGSVQGRAYRAAGSFSPTAGHLSLYAEAEGGTTRLLGTVTWQDTAAERLELLSALLALVSGELRETLTGEHGRRRTLLQEPGLSAEVAAT